jgi:putative ABC transport system permease protein
MLNDLFFRLRSLFRRGEVESELDDELRFHRERQIQKHLDAGFSGEEARRRARLECGGLEQQKELCRDARGTRFFEILWQDLRFALRMLRKSPGFTVVAILTLALGIGANTAIFSVLNVVLLRRLPFPQEERLVRLHDSNRTGSGELRMVNMIARDVLAVRDGSSLYEALVALDGENLTLIQREVPDRVSVVFVSSGWSKVFGVQPILGRMFSPDEERKGISSGVAVVSYGFWQRCFGSDPGILTKSIQLEERTYAIVGIMPEGLRFPYEAEIWAPATLNPADRGVDYAFFGRLKPGVTLAQARAEADSIAAEIRQRDVGVPPGFGIDVTRMREGFVAVEGRVTFAFFGVVAFFLLIACINVATLLLARSVVRQKEFALRAALGASRLRQVRQLLTENVLLALFGGGAGLLLTVWLGKYLTVLLPHVLSRELPTGAVSMDFRVYAFAWFVSCFSAVFFGLLPAFKAVAPDLSEILREGTRGSVGRETRRTMNWFVVSEVALALLLFVGAGLMTESFARQLHGDLGFRPSKLWCVQLTPPVGRYPFGARRGELAEQLLAETRNVPGVQAAAVTTVNPLGGTTWSVPVEIEGRPQPSNGASIVINHRLASAGLFQAMGIALLRGRDFNRQDVATSQPVVIISERMAARYWPGEDGLGKRVRLARPGANWLTVVGVVGNVQDFSAGEVRLETWYLPFAQGAATPAADTLYFMVRLQSSAQNTMDSVREAVRRVDPRLALYNIVAMDQFFSESLSRDRFGAYAVDLFGGFGLLLVALGSYGVIAYSTAQRTRELGIRLAFGAAPVSILSLILKQGLRLSAGGVAIGLVASFFLNRVFSRFLVGLSSAEPAVLAAAVVVMLVVCLLSCYIPARRAMRVDPIVALRYE